MRREDSAVVFSYGDKKILKLSLGRAEEISGDVKNNTSGHIELQKLLYSMCLEREQIIKEYFSLNPCGTKLSKKKTDAFQKNHLHNKQIPGLGVR